MSILLSFKLWIRVSNTSFRQLKVLQSITELERNSWTTILNLPHQEVSLECQAKSWAGFWYYQHFWHLKGYWAHFSWKCHSPKWLARCLMSPVRHMSLFRESQGALSQQVLSTSIFFWGTHLASQTRKSRRGQALEWSTHLCLQWVKQYNSNSLGSYRGAETSQPSCKAKVLAAPFIAEIRDPAKGCEQLQQSQHYFLQDEMSMPQMKAGPT